MHKIKNLIGWNEREWRADLLGTCGFENRPLVCPHQAIEVKDKKLPILGINMKLYVLISIFGLHIEIISNYGFWTYSFQILF